MSEVSGPTTVPEKAPLLTERVVLLSPLRRPDTTWGKSSNKVADAMTRIATRELRRSGIQTDQHMIDFRPESDDIALQRQRLKDVLQGYIENGERVSVIGSSAGGQEALRLGNELGIPAISNQGRLAEGTSQHHTPSLDEAARNHPQFGSAVRDFEKNVAPQVANDSHSNRFLTIGAEQDSIVPRDLKSLSGVPHVEVDSPKGFLGLVNKIKGVDHAIAIYKGLRHSVVKKHIQGS